MPSPKNQTDELAQIAGRGASLDDISLQEPQPVTSPQVQLLPAAEGEKYAFKGAEKIDTHEKLLAELETMQKAYEPFMRHMAPEFESIRKRSTIDSFDWRVQTAEDKKDFTYTLSGRGDWERVTLPHYGGPTGRATTLYRTKTTIERSMMEYGSLFLCFKGVDYEAIVFVNGVYAGAHEGFFAEFEFEISEYVKEGENTVVVQVENYHICKGNEGSENGITADGKKIYAATGLGWDDPQWGWHHCPPGMGIFDSVYIEARKPVHVKDMFVRPLLQQHKAELWLELWSNEIQKREVNAYLSVYGKNFKEMVIDNQEIELQHPLGYGDNKVTHVFSISDPRIWEPESPWLYHACVTITDKDGNVCDRYESHFGMRSFTIDYTTDPKGAFFLNGREIRLRGANTMGHLQQCVLHKKWEQLRDDVLYAKIAHMNFLRLTQRPVQREIYEYCDQLGLMVQTDLPLFGMLNRSQYYEAVRQAGEMERHIRAYPSNIMVTYINEPFPAAWGHTNDQRHLTRKELESFFRAADEAVLLQNPDRVIKPIDGDYDPPGPGLPDYHCYCGWYGGHGVDLGKLHRGYWQPVKAGWHYGCGEFGAEGLDPEHVMKKYYPSEWLPQDSDMESEWTPDKIVRAQSGRMSYIWFERPSTLRKWIERSQQHQRWSVGVQTRAFKRDQRMNTFALHLFIDAFPAGWMKTVMDLERRPKPAYFEYRDALTPLSIDIRTDRYTWHCSDTISAELWVCNDTHAAHDRAWVRYQLEMEGRVVAAGRNETSIAAFRNEIAGILSIGAPRVSERTTVSLRVQLVSEGGEPLHESLREMEVFPEPSSCQTQVCCISNGRLGKLAAILGCDVLTPDQGFSASTILIDDMGIYEKYKQEIDSAVKNGARALFFELPEGNHEIGNDTIHCEKCGLGGVHFVARNTGHTLVRGFRENDFKFWYNDARDMVTPLVDVVFSADSWSPILASGNGDFGGPWYPMHAAAEKEYGSGVFRICQLHLNEQCMNPAAREFARRLVSE